MSNLFLAVFCTSCAVAPALVAVNYGAIPKMSLADKATMYCHDKVADFPPLEATVRCLYVKRMAGNRYAIVVEKIN
jgi:hypothetical protein